MPIKIGLSFMDGTISHETQHSQGLRILELLDGPAQTPGALKTHPSGKPYFADGHAEFNISHSRAMAACAYSADGESMGCDVQYINQSKNYGKIAQKFFSPEETDYMNSEPFEKPKRFCRLWALKESFLKLRGLSVFDIKNAPVFLVQNGGAFYSSSDSCLTFHLYEFGNDADCYALALASELTSPPEVLWCSTTTLPVTHSETIRGTTCAA